MAQFYAEIQGTRGKASRMGDKRSGMWSHTRGWGVGAEVNCEHENGCDVVRVRATHGSNGYGGTPIATITETPNGKRELTLHKPNGKPSITYTF